jgi:hypothetical protein
MSVTVAASAFLAGALTSLATSWLLVIDDAPSSSMRGRVCPMRACRLARTRSITASGAASLSEFVEPGQARLGMRQGTDQSWQLQADEAEHHALQQENHRLVDRVQLQPGRGGRDSLPPLLWLGSLGTRTGREQKGRELGALAACA